MRWIALLACLALSTDGIAAPVVTTDLPGALVTADMKPLPLHVVGRVQVKPVGGRPRGAHSYAQHWPGAYFEGAFTGSEVALRFDDAENEYRLLVDDQPPIRFAQPGRVEARVSGLGAGAHRVRVERVTEGGVGSFGGLFVAAGVPVRAVPARPLQIEFVGDSSMTGYGMRSPGRSCTPLEVSRYSDVQNAYPALTAKALDADYQLVALSGRGVLRNYGDGDASRTLPLLYPNIFQGPSPAYSDPVWRPNLYVIRLIADFTGTIQPGMKWRDFNDLATDYVAAMERFALDLHRRSPRANFVIWWLDAGRVPDARFVQIMNDGQRSIRAALQAAGVREVEFAIETDRGFDNAACHNHMSARDHRIQAEWMTGFLRRHPALLAGGAAR